MPWYKRWLSYITEVPIESRVGAINEVLNLYIVKGRYQLCTANAIYSFADLYDNFYKVFERMNWALLKGDQVLLLGFGLGSIPWMLEKNFQKDLQYTAVEPDLEVLDLARKYVLDELKSPMQIYPTGAVEFLTTTQERYDLICMDVFVDDVIPQAMLKRTFVEKLQSALAEGGLVLYNCLYKTREDKLNTDLFFTDVFQDVFPAAYGVDAGGNLILASDGRFFGR